MGTNDDRDRDRDFEVPVTACYHCDGKLDTASAVDPKTHLPAKGAPPAPKPGSPSICLQCGAVQLFDDDMHLRKPTHDELDEMIRDDDFRAQWASTMWGRQHVMLDHQMVTARPAPPS